MDCFKCKKRVTCKKICKMIDNKLPKVSDGRLKGEFSLSGDYMDRIFAIEEDGSITHLGRKYTPHLRKKGD